jgi:phosphatidylglycerol:prolipoprotein diacylglycerol transferase
MFPNFTGVSWVTTYGVFLLVGLILWWWTARRQAKAIGLDGSHIDLAAPLIIVGGILGARLLSVISPGDADLAGPHYLAAGRLRLLGWIFVGMMVLAAYCRWTRLSFRKMADVFAAPSVLAVSIVRSGCFMAGCGWGDVCIETSQWNPANESRHGLPVQMQTLPWLSGEQYPLAVRFPADSYACHQHIAAGLLDSHATQSLPVHPVQLYDSGLAFGLFLLIWFGFKKSLGQGQATLAAIMGYALIRFPSEYLRADNAIILGNMTFTQLLCLPLFVGCLLALCIRGRRLARLGSVV